MSGPDNHGDRAQANGDRPAEIGGEGDVRREARACDVEDAALKGMFLGPRAENGRWLQARIAELLEGWFAWRRGVYPEDGHAITQADQADPTFSQRQQRAARLVRTLSLRFERELPKHSPRYMAHMFSEISLPALLGHVLTLLHNPNNVSGESSRVGSQIEDEAIGHLATMLGHRPGEGCGHFTSGGTIANFEALARARRRMDRWVSLAALLRSRGAWRGSIVEAAAMGWDTFDALVTAHGVEPGELERFSLVDGNPFEVAERLSEVFGTPWRGPVVLVPQNKHYSWPKGVRVFGHGGEAFRAVALNTSGRLCPRALGEAMDAAHLEGRPVMLVVSVAGTTELGEIDPVDEVQDILDLRAASGLHHWHHVDAAWGGFLASLLRGPGSGASLLGAAPRAALQALPRADSVTLDPHKLGYVPYACGAFLTRDMRDYALMAIDAPYLDLAAGVDRGPQTLEGSRPASGAAATWMTATAFGLDSDGFGRILARTLRARIELQEALEAADFGAHGRVRVMPGCDTNVLAFCIAAPREPLTATNARSHRIHAALGPHRSDAPFVVSRTTLAGPGWAPVVQPFTARWQTRRDVDEVVLVRLCLMNPFFLSREMATDFVQAFRQALGDALEPTPDPGC